LKTLFTDYLPGSWKTLAMRLAIRQSIFLSLLTMLAMLVLYWLVSSFVLVQISSDLEYSLHKLHNIEKQEGQQALIQRLNGLSEENFAREHSHRYYLYLSEDNRILAGSLRHWPDEVIANGKVKNILFEEEDLSKDWTDVDEGLWPAAAMKFSDGSKLLIAQSIDTTEQLNDFTMFVMIFLVVAVTLISLLLGWIQGQTILKKIEHINKTARNIELGELHQRVKQENLSNPDEFDELGIHLNQMLDTIERLMREMKQVSQNIAHDLRKPLTRVQVQLEALQAKSVISPEDLNVCLADLANLSKTFNAILQLGRLESSNSQLAFSTVDLSLLCQSLESVYRDMVEEKGIIWQSTIQEDIKINGDRQLLAQAIINLLENALRYTQAGESIRFSLKQVDSLTSLSIENTGIMLSDNQLTELTKPFVRLDNARSNEGNGLGLSLVKAIAHAHSADLKLSINDNRFTAQINFVSAFKQYG
jgi:signal transduction histidine kinase